MSVHGAAAMPSAPILPLYRPGSGDHERERGMMARLFVQVAFCNSKKGEIHHEDPYTIYELWKELANNLLLGQPLGVALPGGQSADAHPLMVTTYHEPTAPDTPLEIVLSMYK